MAESYDVINLSDLPVPDAIVVPDASVIFGAWLARLRKLDRNLMPGGIRPDLQAGRSDRLSAYPGFPAGE